MLSRFVTRAATLIAALGFFTVLSTSLLAQSGDAEIAGSVKDPSGAALLAAVVTLNNQDSGVARNISTDAEGRYRFYPVAPGRYTLKIEAQGFVTATVAGITVNIGMHLNRDVALTMGNVQDSITVTSEVPPVDVTRTDVSGVVTNQQIDTLPINTRQYLNLALLMPGTSQDSSRTFYNSVQLGGASHYWANGFSVDGVTNTWAEMGEPRQNFPQGAIQEFKVNTIQYKADQGLSAGGVVNIATKSGTNQFHGEAFEYLRNAVLNRDDPFTEAGDKAIGIDKAPFRRNQFGGDVGGPIIPNKAHFYIAFERTQQTSSYNINTGTAGHAYYSTFEGVHSKPMHDQMFNARADYQITNNQQAFVRYSQEWNLITWNGCGGVSMANCYDGQIPRHAVVAGHTWTPSSTVVNEARFQYAYASYQLGPSGSPIWTDIGVITAARLAPMQTTLVFPSFRWGNDYADVGAESRWEGKDDVSIVKGAHTFKLGADVSRIPFADDSPNGYKGQYTFAHDHYFNPNDPASIAALTASNDATVFTATYPPIYNKAPTTHLGLYVQDDWKVARNLTVNLGLRYDRQFGSFNESLNTSSWSQQIPGMGNPADRGSKLNFGPRAGLAWDVRGNSKDVVRAGYGLYYSNIQTLQNFAELRNFAQCSVLVNKPAYPDPYNGQTAAAYCSSTPPSPTILDQKYRNPYTQLANLGYSREVVHDFIVHLDAVYSRTLHDFRTVDLNFPIAGVRPYSTFTRILDHEAIGQAKYKALYVRAEKRFAKRYQFLVSYSLANNKDDNPEVAVTTPANYRLDWGPANADRRHALVASGTAELPWKFSLGAVWTLRSSLPFSATTSATDADGNAQYVAGTSRNIGDRNLSLAVVNAYRAGLGLVALTSSNLDSSRYNSLDMKLSRPIFTRDKMNLDLGVQVFNVFGTENLGVPSGQMTSGGNTANAASANFGRILGALNMQQAELSARFVF